MEEFKPVEPSVSEIGPPEDEKSFSSTPPDGGFLAWTQVLYAHLACFNTWGLANSFAVFQQIYTSTLPESHSQISLIGSIQVFLLFAVGVFAGRATDAGYFGLVYRSGVTLQVLGIFMLSLCKSYWQIFLAQGVLIGLGSGLIYTPTFAVVSTYFDRNRILATSLVMAGGATGALVYPVLIFRLMDHHHVAFGWAIRAAGLIMLISHLPGVIFFKARLPPRTSGPLIEWGAFSEPPFLLFTISFFLNFWGLYLTFFYLGTFARDMIGVEDTLSLILVLNGTSLLGRVLPGLVANRWTGKLNVLIPFNLSMAVVMYSWMAVEDVPGLYAFTAIYGFVGGAAQSLFPGAGTTMTPDINRTGTRMGMILSIVSVASLTGPAIEGALIEQAGGSYTHAQVYSGTVICVAGFFLIAARVAKTGWVFRVRA